MKLISGYNFRPTSILGSIAILILLSSISLTRAQETENKNLTEFIERAFELGLSPGMAVGVVKDNKIVYAKGFGVADITTKGKVTPETLFYIASTTKSFTAFAAALLDDEGVLKLDNSFTDYLPGFKFNSSLKDSVITLRDLLTHTHGIKDNFPIGLRTSYTGEFTDDLLLDLLKESEPSETGRSFDYSNLGYIIYGIVLDKYLKTGWKKILEQKIFTPLEMNNTRAYIKDSDKENLAMPHFVNPEGFIKLNYGKSADNMHAAGGHITNVYDLCRWLLVHINNGRLNGKQIFPENVVKETHRLQAIQDRNFADFHRYGWGLGWDLGTYEGDTLIHRFGSFTGFRSHVSFMPSHKIGVVVLVNEGTLGFYLADFIAEYIYDTMLNKPGIEEKYDSSLKMFEQQAIKVRKHIGDDIAKRMSRSQDLPFPLVEYTGEYVNPELGRMILTLQDQKLHIQMGLAESKVEVYNAENNQLRVEFTGRGEIIKFLFKDNRAEKFVYHGYDFEKVR